MPSDPTTLPLHCPHCGGAVTVQYSDYPDDGPTLPTAYKCPWCGKLHMFTSPGKFLWVTKGHEPPEAQ
jgi:hypothetical protein